MKSERGKKEKEWNETKKEKEEREKREIMCIKMEWRKKEWNEVRKRRKRKNEIIFKKEWKMKRREGTKKIRMHFITEKHIGKMMLTNATKNWNLDCRDEMETRMVILQNDK